MPTDIKSVVEQLITEVLRPLIEADGGGIELVDATDSKVTVRLLRACAGCPGAQFTQSGVIEPAIRAKIGRDIHVVVVRS